MLKLTQMKLDFAVVLIGLLIISIKEYDDIFLNIVYTILPLLDLSISPFGVQSLPCTFFCFRRALHSNDFMENES